MATAPPTSAAAYRITVALGGFVPLVAVFLLNTFDTTDAVSLFVAAPALVSLLAIAAAPETLRVSDTVPSDGVTADRENIVS